MVKTTSYALITMVMMLLVGCSTVKVEPPPPEVIKVEVPVYTKRPDPPQRDLPVLATSKLTDKSSDAETAIAYESDKNILMTEVLWYRKILYDTKE